MNEYDYYFFGFLDEKKMKKLHSLIKETLDPLLTLKQGYLYGLQFNLVYFEKEDHCSTLTIDAQSYLKKTKIELRLTDPIKNAYFLKIRTLLEQLGFKPDLTGNEHLRKAGLTDEEIKGNLSRR